MPQIGWFEILIIVVLSILIIGPKDFPVVVKKVGSWIGSAKRYFNDIQKNISEIDDNSEDKTEDKVKTTNDIEKKDEK